MRCKNPLVYYSKQLIQVKLLMNLPMSRIGLEALNEIKLLSNSTVQNIPRDIDVRFSYLPPEGCKIIGYCRSFY